MDIPNTFQVPSGFSFCLISLAVGTPLTLVKATLGLDFWSLPASANNGAFATC